MFVATTTTGVASSRSVGVTGGGQDNGHGRAGERRQARTLQCQARGRVEQASLGGGQQQWPQRHGQAWQDRLRLRVAEPGVALQQDRSVGGEHQPGVQRPTERGAAPGQLGQDRPVEALDEVVGRAIRQVRERRVRAHPAGVGAGVAITQALVVAGVRQGQRVAAVAQGDAAGLATVQALLEHDAGAGLAKDRARGRQGLREVSRHHDTLAGRQPVGLDDDTVPLGVQVSGEGQRGIQLCRHEGASPRHRHARGGGDLVAERLAGLDPRGGSRRPEDRDPGRRHGVRDACRQGGLRPDDDEFRGHGTGCRHDRRATERIHTRHPHDPRLGDDGVTARRHEHLVHAGLQAELPGQGVFAAAAPDDEDAGRHHEAPGAHAGIPGRWRMGRQARSIVCVRSGPTDTSTIGTPACCSMAVT